MDGHLYPVLARASDEELKLIHRYAQLYRQGIACEAEALTQAILDMACPDYQSSLCHMVHHLDGTATVNDPVPEMEATLLVLLFNQALQNVHGADLVELKRGLHRYGLRNEDWSIEMKGESVNGARLQQLLLSEGLTAYLLMQEVVRVIFTHLFAHGDAQDDGGMLSNGFATILFGQVFCLFVDILKGLFGARYDKLIPIAVHVAMLRKRGVVRG
ncbi:MAG: hypothetical protein R3Y56_07625 [Akkermansia sp.]